MKLCPKCEVVKELTEFNKKTFPDGTIGKRSYCKQCDGNARKEWRAKSPKDNERNKLYNRLNANVIAAKKLCKYWPGSTPREALLYYNELLVLQNHVCAICKKPESRFDKRSGKPRKLAVDHCHNSGPVRGLLCNKCNRGIGLLDEMEDILLAALEYLRKHKVGLLKAS